jgi:hypothetical protein
LLHQGSQLTKSGLKPEPEQNNDLPGILLYAVLQRTTWAIPQLLCLVGVCFYVA